MIFDDLAMNISRCSMAGSFPGHAMEDPKKIPSACSHDRIAETTQRMMFGKGNLPCPLDFDRQQVGLPTTFAEDYQCMRQAMGSTSGFEKCGPVDDEFCFAEPFWNVDHFCGT